jgi:hypothetical protein
MNKLKIGDRVKTEDGIGKVVFIDDNAFKFPNKMGVDVLIDGCSEQYGYSLSDLELISSNWFTVESMSVTYSDAEGNQLTITSVEGYPNQLEMQSDRFAFDKEKKPDDIIADFKRRAQV